MNKGTAIVAILIAFVGGLAIGNLLGSSNSPEDVSIVEARLDDNNRAAGGTEATEITRYRVPVTDGQPSKGPKNALVTVVEFSEFECPFCKRVLPTTSRVIQEYGDRVRVVWRNNPLPFHQNARPAATAAMEAFAQGGADKFWAMHDKLFENQRALSREDLERYGTQLGLDMARFRQALDNNTHNAKIQQDQQLAAQLGARGTPAFFINGVQLMGAQPFERFKEVIDRELAHAEQLVQSGTPRDRLYANLIQNGRTTPAPAKAAKNKAPSARRQPDPAAVYKVELAGNHPQKGPDDALVTIIEVSDFECPFCSRVLPTVSQVFEEYGNDVRVMWFHNPLPFHRNAPLAHRASIEVFEQAGDEKFWAYHDKLFENQRALQREDLEGYAQALGGINMGRFRAALDGEKHQETITKDQSVARRFGATGTPSFFINGRNLRGAQPFAAFKRVIDEELERARALVRSGTPRSQVYAAAIREGATSPQYLEAPGQQAPERNAPDPDQRYEIPLPAKAPSAGGANAKVVIQEFSDFQCPFCSRVLPTLNQVKERFGNRVRIIWRNYPLPFHSEAHLAAQASLEVFRQGGSGTFWKFHDKLFENQRELQRPKLEEYAAGLGGINMAEFRAALDSERHKAAVDADIAAVREAGARIGTPSFFINGKLLQGAQPFTAFESAINEALEKVN